MNQLRALWPEDLDRPEEHKYKPIIFDETKETIEVILRPDVLKYYQIQDVVSPDPIKRKFWMVVAMDYHTNVIFLRKCIEKEQK